MKPLGFFVVGVAVVLLGATWAAPSEQPAGGTTWNTWTAEAKTRAVALTAAGTGVGTSTVTPPAAPTVAPTGTPAPAAAVLAFTPGPGLCGRLCVEGLPLAFCWDVCLDSSFRMVKVDGGN